MAILGLMTTTQLESERALNARRKVFYDYPNGKFPLMGLLSLMEDAEELSDPEFGWHEERWQSARSLTAAAESGKGPFATSTAGTTAASEATIALAATAYLKVVDATQFRVRDVIRIKNLYTTTATTPVQTTAWVTAVDNSTNVLTIKLMDTTLASDTGPKNSNTTNNSLYVSVIGTATGEGDRSRSDGRVGEPFKLTNYTQIFRSVVGPFTGTALKMGQKYDSKPLYRKAAKDGALRHMELLEKAALYGVARSTTTTTIDNDTVPVRYTGGIEYFLNQWDKGNTPNGGAFNYRPNGTDLSAADWRDYDEKRVLRSVGSITSGEWEELIRRMFASQSDSGFEKLVICGDKTLAAVNRWVQNKSVTTRDLKTKEESYGLQIKQVDTVHGSLMFKTHPLFKEDPSMQNTMLVVDMGDIVYHCMEGRDTELLKNRQQRDADHRKDEWLTECGFEVRHPKRHMWIDGLTEILA